jgi:aminoglycoside phosphotransferase (APT) family kinase protein
MSALERALHAAVPDRDPVRIDRQTTRPGNRTAHVTFGDDCGPVYIKTASDTTARLTREVAALRYAASHCSVGTPAVVAADVTADPPYLVTDPLPGTQFNDRWTGAGGSTVPDGERSTDRAALLRAVGRAIAGVHEATFATPGVIVGDRTDRADREDTTTAGDLQLETDSWSETICATITQRATDWFPDRFADLPARLVETVRAVEPTLAATDTTPTLLHADVSRLNVHLDPVGLLDWERALVGDPAFDLIDAAFHHTGQPDVDDGARSALVTALFDGYRDRAGTVPAGVDGYRHLYRAVAYLLVPQAFDDWAPDAEAPMDDLAASVREEFDTRVTAAREAAD